MRTGLFRKQLVTAYTEMLRSGSMTGGPLSATTDDNAHSSLRKALNDGVRLLVLLGNPATADRPPKRTEPEMETWTASELNAFLAGVEDDPLHAGYILIANTGVRLGEAMGLRAGTPVHPDRWTRASKRQVKS